jgi:hypothetical protein
MLRLVFFRLMLRVVNLQRKRTDGDLTEPQPGIEFLFDDEGPECFPEFYPATQSGFHTHLMALCLQAKTHGVLLFSGLHAAQV